MRFISWLSIYVLTLLVEAVILPRFFGGAVPSLTAAVLAAGIVSQRFAAGFWFSALAGLISDIAFVSAGTFSHGASALGIFLAVSLFRALVQLDEPLNRIASLLVAFFIRPFAGVAAAFVSRFAFGAPAAGLPAMLKSFAVSREIIFVLLFAAAFAFLTIRRFNRRRQEELVRI